MGVKDNRGAAVGVAQDTRLPNVLQRKRINTTGSYAFQQYKSLSIHYAIPWSEMLFWDSDDSFCFPPKDQAGLKELHS